MKYLSSSTHCLKVICKVKFSDRILECQNDRQDKNNMHPNLRSRVHKKIALDCVTTNLSPVAQCVDKHPLGAQKQQLTIVTDHGLVARFLPRHCLQNNHQVYIYVQMKNFFSICNTGILNFKYLLQ